MNDYARISLIEAIALQYNRGSLYGLSFNREEKRSLAKEIEEKIPSDMITLLEWNEALHLLCSCAPEDSNDKARQKLLNELRCS